jgi:fructokinase
MNEAAVEVVGLGEVLWDLLPGGRQLGGAPFNFAFHCQQLGHPSAIVSRLGADELGREARAAVRRLGVCADYLQEDDSRPTGTASVALDAGGQPTFTITPEVAYDYLAWGQNLRPLFARARAVCFGTLAQRCPVARGAVQCALAAARDAVVVFDVNLRQDYYSQEIIEGSLRASRWVKLNEDELTLLHGMLGLSGTTPAEMLTDLRRRFNQEVAALTRGARGCLVQAAGEQIDLPGVPVEVVDTVGAGDAFTAGLVAGTLEGRSLAQAASFANRLAARVAASAGGTPVIDRADIDRMSVG